MGLSSQIYDIFRYVVKNLFKIRKLSICKFVGKLVMDKYRNYFEWFLHFCEFHLTAILKAWMYSCIGGMASFDPGLSVLFVFDRLLMIIQNAYIVFALKMTQ